MVTIGESESGLAQALAGTLTEFLPQTEGYAIHVEIYENDRKKRRDASRQSWRPGAGEIVIKFDGPALAQTTENSSQYEKSSTLSIRPDEPSDHDRRLIDFINSLNTAEQRPGFDFVALKWFRDVLLPAESYEWAESPIARDEVIRSAVEWGIALTSKVPNPKNPRFPVTAIRLNRLHPEVTGALGSKEIDAEFQPLEIQGEPLSSTVLRERR